MTAGQSAATLGSELRNTSAFSEGGWRHVCSSVKASGIGHRGCPKAKQQLEHQVECLCGNPFPFQDPQDGHKNEECLGLRHWRVEDVDPAGPGTNCERVLPRAAKLMGHGDIQVNLSGDRMRSTFLCPYIPFQPPETVRCLSDLQT